MGPGLAALAPGLVHDLAPGGRCPGAALVDPPGRLAGQPAPLGVAHHAATRLRGRRRPEPSPGRRRAPRPIRRDAPATTIGETSDPATPSGTREPGGRSTAGDDRPARTRRARPTSAAVRTGPRSRGDERDELTEPEERGPPRRAGRTARPDDPERIPARGRDPPGRRAPAGGAATARRRTGRGLGHGGSVSRPTGPKTTNEAPKGLVQGEIRRRPTLPGSLLPSTIGAGGLNFRVRNGNGCDPTAMATEICCQERAATRSPWGARALEELHSEHERHCRSKPSAD